ncbi:TNF receptor-associated factor 3-like [Diadema antillarum]
MVGVDLDLEMDSNRKTSAQDVTCPLCKLPHREPFSGDCKHACCKSCWAVYLTKNLPALEQIKCPTCSAALKLRELKPDQTAQRRLQKFKNARCKNCSWRGSYTDYIENHERVCGKVVRIQCKVFGCGKWLPKNRALELHRADDWCPMILLMKTRLTQAEILHLSMRETWDWTCGLVLRSEKAEVRLYIERLVLVFSVLDPKMPTALENDEYGATAQITEDMCDGDVSASRGASQWTDNSSQKKLSREENSGSSASRNEPDGHSRIGLSRENSMVGSAALNGTYSDLSPSAEVVRTVFQRRTSADEKGSDTNADLETLKQKVSKLSQEADKHISHFDDLQKLTRAFAAMNDKHSVLEGIVSTLHHEVIAGSSKIDSLQASSDFGSPRKLEKVYKSIDKLQQEIDSLFQSLQKQEIRILELEYSYSGVFLWKIESYSQRKKEAATTNVKSIYSKPFFTSQYGYKLCGRVFLMGDGVGKGTHISLFLTIMRGQYDAVLPWPFKQKITFQLVNQADPLNKSIVEAFRPDPTSSSFKRPTSDRNIGAGCPLFAKIQLVEDPNQGFLKDDTLYLKIISQTSDVPELK